MRKILIFLAVVIAASLFLSRDVEAVTVGPAKLEFSVERGDKVTGQFFVMNEEQEEKTYYSSFEKFSEKNGERIYLAGERTEVAYWLNSSSSVTLKPGEHRYIPFEINIPADAPPGGHYAVVWWSDAVPENNTDSVAIITRVGVLVYIRVAGDVKEVASLSSLTPDNKTLFSKTPLQFDVRVKNEGNVHLKPQGEIEIKNIFNRKRAVIPVNEKGKIILPEESADFISKWEPRFAFGPYQASVLLSYGEPNSLGERKQLIESKWVYVFPLHLVGMLILLLIIIFGVIPYGIRSYNRWLINTALESHGLKMNKKSTKTRSRRKNMQQGKLESES